MHALNESVTPIELQTVNLWGFLDVFHFANEPSMPCSITRYVQNYAINNYLWFPITCITFLNSLSGFAGENN